VLKSTKYQIKPKQSHYDCLEIDEFWTEEQGMAYLRISPGKRGNSSLCMGKTGFKDGTKAEEEDKTAGDRL
jgi:hypothetical protein